jgi:hypothetical protein
MVCDTQIYWGSGLCPTSGSVIHHHRVLVFNPEWWTKARTPVFQGSCQNPITVARVEAWARSCGMYGGKRGMGKGFLQVLQFTMPVLVPLTDPHSLFIIQGLCAVGQILGSTCTSLGPSLNSLWQSKILYCSIVPISYHLFFFL